VAICNTISVGSLGPAVILHDVYDHTVIDRSILQTAGADPMPTIVWGQSTDQRQSFGDEDINVGQFQTDTGQACYLIAGVAPESMFVDYAGGDLQLTVGAPALDFGVGEGAPVYDFARNLRGAVNGLFDVGAYEFTDPLVNAADPSWAAYR
jgi:hypothetical protein